MALGFPVFWWLPVLKYRHSSTNTETAHFGSFTKRLPVSKDHWSLFINVHFFAELVYRLNLFRMKCQSFFTAFGHQCSRRKKCTCIRHNGVRTLYSFLRIAQAKCLPLRSKRKFLNECPYVTQKLFSDLLKNQWWNWSGLLPYHILSYEDVTVKGILHMQFAARGFSHPRCGE